jgi:superfamily II RNA helicase
MKDITKKKIKLFIPAVIIVPVMLFCILWLLPDPPKPYTLDTVKAGEYYQKTFSVRQTEGKYVPMAHVYWLQDKLLSADDVIKILQASNAGYVWTANFDDSNYTRWRRSDDKIEATHRKQDGRLLIYRKEFAEWQNKHKERNAELILRIMK